MKYIDISSDQILPAWTKELQGELSKKLKKVFINDKIEIDHVEWTAEGLRVYLAGEVDEDQSTK